MIQDEQISELKKIVEPKIKIEDKDYDLMFKIGVAFSIIFAILEIIVRIRKVKYPKYMWILDIVALISASLMLIYHYLYRWQFVIVIMFLILLICKTIYHSLRIFNIKNIF